MDSGGILESLGEILLYSIINILYTFGIIVMYFGQMQCLLERF